MEQNMILFLIVGIVTGIFAGFFGIGGGLVIIPALVWIFHMSQHEAQGLSLAALLLPVGFLGFWVYRQHHPIPLKPALMIAIGIFVGSYFGSLVAQQVSSKHLKIAFGILLVIAGSKMIIGK